MNTFKKETYYLHDLHETILFLELKKTRDNRTNNQTNKELYPVRYMCRADLTHTT